LIGLSGLFSLFGPSEIGFAFHPVRFRYGTGGINLSGLFGLFGLFGFFGLSSLSGFSGLSGFSRFFSLFGLFGLSEFCDY